ncbi:MAG: hypothetical protein L3J39_02380 [Verrucomicrobiales bacterium]|nr:hypothetical protein [Verrucomicrobiales bacterium]
MSGKKTKLKAGCGVVTLFGLGYVLGVVSLFILIAVIVPLTEGWKSDKSKKFIADHIANKLDLADEQREQLRPVVNEFLDRRWQLRRDYLQESESVMVEEYQPRLDEFLTDPQQQKLEELLQGWRKENQDKIEEPAER